MLECTYIQIPQVEHTHAVVLSKPAWMWGAEMGANDQGVCIGNEAVWTREPVSPGESLLGMDLVRLGLERGDSAWAALTVITDLLEQHGQGGPCREDPEPFSYHNTFLLVDRNQAWVLETAGRLWVAQKVTEGVKNISNQLTVGAEISAEHPELRSVAQAQGWWDGEEEFNFSRVFTPENPPARMELSDGSGDDVHFEGQAQWHLHGLWRFLHHRQHGVCPSQRLQPALHPLLHRHPRPLQPFIFSDCSVPVPRVVSPQFGPDDPVRKQPRFQSQVDRRHDLYKAHQDEGLAVYEILRDLESQCLSEISAMLNGEIPVEELGDCFLIPWTQRSSSTSEQ
ncbi:hypothetical protein FQN60_005312, partial [Etheostoma spectabile]